MGGARGKRPAAVLVHGFGAFRDESVATAPHQSGSLQATRFSDTYAPPVGAAVRLLHGRDERVRPLATRDIAGDALGAHAEFAGDASSFVAQAFGAARRKHEVDVLVGKAFRDREPDADAAAGDDGDLALEPRSMIPLFYQQV